MRHCSNHHYDVCVHVLSGIEVDAPSGRTTTRAILLQCSADLLGRAPLTNMKNFNGKWGCLYCTNLGKTLGTGHLHRFWPDNPSSVLRTKESFIEDGKLALTTGNPVSMILGSCVHTCM